MEHHVDAGDGASDELAVADVPEYEGDVRGRRSPDCTGEVLDAPPAEVVEQDDLADADAT